MRDQQNLNTSHVKLQTSFEKNDNSQEAHLNTSPVKLQLDLLKEGEFVVFLFKYISC